VVAPADYLTLIDLLNGAGTFIVWNGKTLPTNTCAGGALLAESSSGPMPVDDENQKFADWLVHYLPTANPIEAARVDDFQTIVGGLTQWCVDHFTAAERAALAARLSDPTLTFTSDLAAGMVPGIVEALVP
jgi:hypothetical protein